MEVALKQEILAFFDRWLPGMGAFLFVGIRILAIVIAAWIAIAVLRRVLKSFHARITRRLGDAESIKRAETLSRVFRYLVTAVVSLLAGMLVLSELGVSVAPILGAAGVVGLAIGFGAQTLVKDFFGGFFILLENQIRRGDVVKLGEHAGSVEEINLRYVRLRDYAGHVHFVPNSSITSVVNMSYGYANAVVDVAVVDKEDLAQVTQVMQDVAIKLRADPLFSSRILDSFELAGIQRWSDSVIVIRGRFRVVALEQWAVRREYLKLLKSAFDELGIKTPQFTVLSGSISDIPKSRISESSDDSPAA